MIQIKKMIRIQIKIPLIFSNYHQILAIKRVEMEVVEKKAPLFPFGQ